MRAILMFHNCEGQNHKTVHVHRPQQIGRRPAAFMCGPKQRMAHVTVDVCLIVNLHIVGVYIIVNLHIVGVYIIVNLHTVGVCLIVKLHSYTGCLPNRQAPHCGCLPNRHAPQPIDCHVTCRRDCTCSAMFRVRAHEDARRAAVGRGNLLRIGNRWSRSCVCVCVCVCMCVCMCVCACVCVCVYVCA